VEHIDKLNEGIEDVIRNPTRDEASEAPDFSASNNESSLLQDRYRTLKEWSLSRRDIEKASLVQGVNELVITN
jgi:hypothetical protein